MDQTQTNTLYIKLATDVVSAYVSNNPLPAADLPGLLDSAHAALTKMGQGTVDAPQVDLVPAVPVKKSVTPDYIVCLEDGRKYKSLKRHLRAVYNLSPEQYRAKWGLPNDYPMVAPNYSDARSSLAKSMGLGQHGRKRR